MTVIDPANPDLFELEPDQVPLLRPASHLLVTTLGGRVLFEGLFHDVEARPSGEWTLELYRFTDAGDRVGFWVGSDDLEDCKVFLRMPTLRSAFVDVETAGQRAMKPLLDVALWTIRLLNRATRRRPR